MKKIFICVVLIGILSSCEMLINNTIDSYIYSKLEDIEYYDFAEYDLSDINSLRNVGTFLQSNTKFRYDSLDEWYSPREFMLRGGGDCEDFAIAFMNIAHITLGIKMDLVVVNMQNRSVVEGGIGNHFVVRYEGVNYSGQWGYKDADQEVLYLYTFDEVFGGGY